jgi:methanogenic corrinoid protein MtbC1
MEYKMLDVNELTKAMGDLDEAKLTALAEDFIAEKPSDAETQEAISALQNGMAAVGDLFEKGDYFIGDLIFAGELLTELAAMLKPETGSAGSSRAGKIVLGTVKSDLHDIGKNIFKTMAVAAGFEVHDLGIDQDVEVFVDKVRELKPDVLGLSGVLTLAVNSMKATVDALKTAGLKDQVKVIIGGACASKEAMVVSGADAWTTNAAEGVKICLDWVKR